MSRTTLKTVSNTNGYYRINNLRVNIDLKKITIFFQLMIHTSLIFSDIPDHQMSTFLEITPLPYREEALGGRKHILSCIDS